MAEWADEPLEEREYPDEPDLDEPDEEEQALASLAPCPACGKMVYAESPQCPHCRTWLHELELGNSSGPAKWYVRIGRWAGWLWLLLAALAALGVLSGLWTWWRRHG